MPSSPQDLHSHLPPDSAPEAAHRESHEHDEVHGDKWLVLIGALKVVRGCFVVLLGFAALRLLHRDLMHRDLVAILNHWMVTVLRFDPESHLVNFILAKAAHIHPRELRMLSAAIFIYAALDLIEGTGLVLEKVWAEYVTLTITAAFLPWEFYEVILRASAFRIGLVLANLVIVLYLFWVVQAQARRRMARRARHRPRS